MLHRAADLADIDSELGEMSGKAWFGEHEHRVDIAAMRHRDCAQIEPDGNIGKTWLASGAEVLVVDRRGALRFAASTSVVGTYRQPGNLGDSFAGQFHRIDEMERSSVAAHVRSNGRRPLRSLGSVSTRRVQPTRVSGSVLVRMRLG